VRKLRVALVLFAGLWAAVGLCPAQEARKPVLVVSFAGYDRLLKNVDFIGKLAGNENLGPGAEARLKLMTGNQGLVGLDAQRPWGMAVELEGLPPFFYGFIPAGDVKQFLGVLPQLDVREKPNGVLEIQTPKQPVYAKQHGKWVCLCAQPEDFGKLPADPAAALGDLPQKYDLAVRVNVANIPPENLAARAAQIRALLQDRGDQPLPGETEAQYALRKQAGEQMIQSAMKTISDLEQATLGLAIDQQARTLYLEALVTAKPGTALAQAFAQAGVPKTNFAGFRDPAAVVSAVWAGTLSANDVANATTLLQAIHTKMLQDLKQGPRAAEFLQKRQQALQALFDVALATVKAGRVDGGLAVYYTANKLTAAAGSFVADGPGLDAGLKQLFEIAKSERPEVQQHVKLDVGQHQGIQFHMATPPLPPGGEEREKAVALVGQNPEVVVGTGPQSAYAALGCETLDTLKRLIDRSASAGAKTVPPLEVSIALGPLMALGAQTGEPSQRMLVELMATLLEQTGGKDHVTLTATQAERGVRVRLDVEEGILKVFGSMGQLMGAGVPGAPAGKPF